MSVRAVTCVVLSGLAASSTLAQSLTTEQPNNGRSDAGAGIFFDLTASVDLRVTAFRFFPNSAAGSPVQVEIMLYPSRSYINNFSDPMGWVLHDTVQTSSAGPAPAETGVLLSNPIELDAGETVGVYFINQESGGVRYTGTSAAPPQTTWMTPELTLYSEHARGGPPFSGSLFTPRCFSGTVAYEVVSSGCYADCDTASGAGVLDIFDFLCFQDAFTNGDPYACDCDTASGAGVCDIFDFLCFQDAFTNGCP